jgi:hypothetical protein
VQVAYDMRLRVSTWVPFCVAATCHWDCNATVLMIQWVWSHHPAHLHFFLFFRWETLDIYLHVSLLWVKLWVTSVKQRGMQTLVIDHLHGCMEATPYAFNSSWRAWNLQYANVKYSTTFDRKWVMFRRALSSQISQSLIGCFLYYYFLKILFSWLCTIIHENLAIKVASQKQWTCTVVQTLNIFDQIKTVCYFIPI